MPKTKRILIVEDNHELAEVISNALHSSGIYSDIVHTGYGALAAANRIPYELVLLDIVLPDIDGRTVCTRLRQQKIFVPVIFLSSKNTLPYILSALKTSGDGYITKPFHMAELIARIEAMLNRPPQPHLDKITIDDIELNLISKELYMNSHKVPIRKKDFEILSLLIMRKNTVVCREELRKVCPENNKIMPDASLDTHISCIRRTLGSKLPGKIETMHGVGYKFTYNRD